MLSSRRPLTGAAKEEAVAWSPPRAARRARTRLCSAFSMGGQVPGLAVTGERVPAQFLEAGDVIRVRHHHDSQRGRCLSHWETDAVVAEGPAPVCGRLAVRWAGDARFHGGRPAVTGISVFRPHERALRIGRIPGSWAWGLHLVGRQGCAPPPGVAAGRNAGRSVGAEGEDGCCVEGLSWVQDGGWEVRLVR